MNFRLFSKVTQLATINLTHNHMKALRITCIVNRLYLMHPQNIYLPWWLYL
jgi:hypothetical protein